MMNKYIFINLLEAFYTYFMLSKFKTSYSIHHPLEIFILKNVPNYYYHPISTGKFESKICPFGNLCGKLFPMFFGYRILFNLIYKKKETFLTKIVIISSIIISLLMNLNAFIYLIPIFIIEWNYI